jgi:hypothetical protein
MSTSNSKKRRIMIITGDESIIEQIQSSNNSSLIKSIIIEPKDDGNDFSYSPVRSLFLPNYSNLYIYLVFKRNTIIKSKEDEKYFINLCCLWFGSTWI